MDKLVKYEFIKIDKDKMLFKCYNTDTGKVKFEKIIDKKRKNKNI